MSHQLPDVQATAPDVRIGLEQVGVTGVEKLVEVAREDDRPYVLMAEFAVTVDLPRERKGLDMSRNMEAIDEVLEEAVSDPIYRVEDMVGQVAEHLLEKHAYTSTATVSMEAEFAVKDVTPASERPTQSTVDILASATAAEGEPTREEVGTRVDGMTVCPCSQGMMEETASEKLTELGLEEGDVEEFLREVPQAGHSQRGHATLAVETAGHPDVDIRDLVDIARDSMSARIYNLAKRPDEDAMTYRAHANARFVEDCVRTMAERVVEECDHLADDAVVTMRQSNDESIHQHNAHAERIATMGQLRDELDRA
ncbi:GTP cyclohydrolase MptA [Halanaeroarchaeum sulfurireducens]|uniref:GTP cyclohydrolase MptA n=1 Tax=Halanaeroarchaeum sulfurireducens TaxID=1604004 RepID=A0A0F7PCH9_9EURY|nr:GTP cyclohydrolase MptA [Halanaeroarchaeum sulfurireducens]AKH98402.1 GTP cyclohydrolase I [Halanaeroarchaeum sulfurireducens]ALG82796.1 GTP cyclohydrolase I [Halanaeroarchaeum sulfurireducens]